VVWEPSEVGKRPESNRARHYYYSNIFWVPRNSGAAHRPDCAVLSPTGKVGPVRANHLLSTNLVSMTTLMASPNNRSVDDRGDHDHCRGHA